MSVHYDKQRKHYFFIVRVKDSDGNLRQIKKRGFKSNKEAKLAEAEFMLNYEKGEELIDNPKFKEIALEYLSWYKKRRKTSSYIKIKSIVKVNLIPHFESKRINDIKNRDITKFHDLLIEKNYSAHQAKKIHTTLSAIFNYAIKQEYAKHNPAKIVGNLEMREEKRLDYWTLEEFRQFIKVVDHKLYHALFMTLYYSGMRKGELLALTWSDIDFDNNTININKTSYNGNITTTKTAGSTRIITMPKHTMRTLSQLKASRLNVKMGHKVFGEFNDHVATSTLDRYFERYVKKSGVKRIRLHDFRHSHASYLINRNAIPAVVAQRLGHSDVATTLNTYSHLYPSTEKEIVSKMEDDFKPAKIYKITK